ncbi:MAG: PAS domain S-box protein [Bacteroidetes bacterium]|nr:PAS domain S-box protein [Bacteroidota bacterium]MBU1580853.1 PAS domain S-box protein [Bacteroidota bacterium]MBU2558403.1 PAS domain S-box protein [Bacteroidota bacterium]
MMKTNIRHLIDLNKIDTLLEGFNKSTGFVTAIIDLEGNVLSKSGWRSICTEFHRFNPETSKRCIISDTELANKMKTGEKYHAYKCMNGLMDVAVPLKINGEHIANLFSGQFFFEKPDHAFFKKQAEAFGFDEKKYLEALNKVPVVSEEKVKVAMDFLLNMTEFISELAIQKLEQEKISQNLKDNEQKFKSVFESANVGKSITLPSGEINVNEAYCKILGYTREELKNKKWQDITPKEDIPTIQKIIEGLIASEKDSARFEKRYICKNGSLLWTDVNVTLLRDKNNQPLHFITTMVDISDRKMTEQALRESEEKFFTLFEKLPFAVTLSKVPDEKFIAVNEAFEREFGFTKHEALGKNSKDLGINPDAEDRKRILEKLKASNSVRNQEMVLHSKSGEKHYYETNIDQVNINGEEYLLNTTQNISEYKRAQNKLRESYDLIRIAGEKAKLGGWNVMLKENRSYWSDEVAAIHEMPAGYSPLVKDGINFYAPEWRKKIVEVFDKCAQDGIPYDEEMEIITATGKRVWVRTIGEAVKDKNGNIFKIQGAMQDITLQKQAQKDLKTSEVRYKAIFESTGTATLIVDEDTTILLANNECFDVFGYDPAQLLGQKWTLFVAPESVQEMLKNHHLRRQNSKLAPRKYEVKLLNNKAEKRDVILNISMIPGTKHSVVSMLDITERKQAEEALQKSKSNLEEYFENDISANYVVTVSGEILSCNKTFLNLFGFEKRSDSEGFNITELFKNPSDRDQMIQRIKKQRKVESFEVEFISKEGITIYALINALGIFDTDDKLEKIRGYVVEITEQKRFEETRKLLLEISQLTTKHYTLTSFLAEVHQKIRQIIRADNFYVALYNATDNTFSFPYHVDEQDQVELNKPYDFSNGFTDYVLKTNQSLIITPKHQLEVEQDGTIKGYGDELSVWLGVPFKTAEDSKPSGVIAIQDYQNLESYTETDKSIMEIIAQSIGSFIERIKYLEELVQAKEKAEASDKLKTAFINNISHEIRTPLNGILGFGQFLAETELSQAERVDLLEHVNNAAYRLTDTVTDYMDIAMIFSETMEVHEKEFTLKPFFEEIIENSKQQSAAKQIAIHTEILIESSDFSICSDPEFIRKILGKLINNAIKFTEQGSINCGYRIMPGFVEFFIQDTGKGIASDKLELIFEMFTQEDLSMTRGYEGSGLGLSIAKGLVTLLGGKINVTSVKDKGSTFRFTIPVNNIALPTTKDALPAIEINHKEKPLILIAEDDESNYKYAAVILNSIGYNHIHAINGAEAVAFCQQNAAISIVLMDIKMPVMNGIEATKLIREFRPELPVVATTAYAQTGDEHRILEAGCNDYLAKPIKMEKLLSLIRKYVE